MNIKRTYEERYGVPEVSYQRRLFRIDDQLCFWEIRYDDEGPICHRFIDGPRTLDNWENEREYERHVRPQRARMLKKERVLMESLFDLMHTDEETRERVEALLLRDRWCKMGRVMVEKLAKADLEKYGEVEGVPFQGKGE